MQVVVLDGREGDKKGLSTCVNHIRVLICVH